MAIEVCCLEYDPKTGMVTDDVGDIDYKNIIEMIDSLRLEYLKKYGGVECIKDVEPGVWYKIEFPVPDDLDYITLYYDEGNNLFEDGDGRVIYNIFDYASPSELMIFKQTKDDMIFYGKNRMTAELVYPKYDDEEVE